MFENYYPQKWWVARLPKYATQGFSYKYVICPAANYKRSFPVHTFRVIISHLKRAYKYWFHRCKDLVCADLWLPTSPDNNATVIHRAVQHCLYCVPSHLVLHRDKKPIKVKPCSQSQICPFCAARVAEDLYRRLMRTLGNLSEIGVTGVASYRCERYVISAAHLDDSWTPAQFQAHICKLASKLKRERNRYQQISKELKIHTLGSLWAVVPYPVDNGWAIEVRQFFISRHNARRPANRKKKSSTLQVESVNTRSTRSVVKLLGNFVSYPPTLLTAQIELTATALHARRGLRLLNGTGQLYRQGRKSKPAQEVPAPDSVP